MRKSIPRIMIAAPCSGSGKTVLTCGILQALKNRGLNCRAFKCGPDYIDPLFHRQVLGISGGNLDTFFLSEEAVGGQLAGAAEESDISILEGVMGFYDGLGGIQVKASACHVAEATQTPVVLVVDGRGASLSVAAVVKGFLTFRENSRICGVILNRVSPKMAERLNPILEDLGVAVLGCLPICEAAKLDSRHLGLVLPGELEGLQEQLQKLGEQVEANVDLDRLLALAAGAEPLEIPDRLEARKEPVEIAVARDPAFQFYYEENLELLRQLGARLLFFSPMEEESLPPGAAGLLLGGGYPEQYADRLAANTPMRNQVKEAVQKGMPVLAECGGFLYLQESLETADGKQYPMAGVLPGHGYPTGKLSRFGYLELECKKEGGLLKPGETIKGHEFHYWDTTEPGDAFWGRKPVGNTGWNCMVQQGNLLAGFPHLYYPSNPGFVKAWLDRCRVWGRGNKTQKIEISQN